MANDIKDFSRIIAELEDGQFNADCSAKLQESLKALQERCDIDGLRSAKAQIAVAITLVKIRPNRAIAQSSGCLMTGKAFVVKTPSNRACRLMLLPASGKL